VDLFKIKTFLRAVELGSMSKAAQEMEYAPSALSHMMHALEQEVGLTLMKRSPSGITLTENGQKLLPLFQAVVDSENAIHVTAKKLAGSQNIIRIGTYSSVAKAILPKIIKTFNEEHPQTKISVTVANRFSNKLVDSKLDVVLATRGETANSQWVPLWDDTYVILAKEDWLPGKEEVALEEVEDFTFIMPSISVVEQLCRDRFRDIMEVSSDDDTSLISMVKEGLGITILPYLSVCGGFEGVRHLKLNPSVVRTLGLTYYKNNMTPICLQFVEHIKKQIPKIVNL